MGHLNRVTTDFFDDVEIFFVKGGDAVYAAGKADAGDFKIMNLQADGLIP